MASRVPGESADRGHNDHGPGTESQETGDATTTDLVTIPESTLVDIPDAGLVDIPGTGLIDLP